MTGTIRERIYRTYLEFLETAEKKRNWSVFDDIPWEALEGGKATEARARCVEVFCAEELYVPDYSSEGLELIRSKFGIAWFQLRWAFEESKHGLVFREYLARSGLRSEAEVEALEASVFAKAWKLPFQTPCQMACYGALQEGLTYAAYRLQKEKARCVGDSVLEAIFRLVGRDEAAHAGFYRAIIEIELSQNRAATVADLASVVSRFKMPGAGLISNYNEKLRAYGAGISTRAFVEGVVWPLLITLEISKEELKQAMKARSDAVLRCDP